MTVIVLNNILVLPFTLYSEELDYKGFNILAGTQNLRNFECHKRIELPS